MAKRIGIFSGTFDPVHKGHVAFALQAIEQADLDEVYFAPEVRPRHKPNVTHIGHRLSMLKLATRPYKNLKVLELPEKHFSTKITLPKLEQKFKNDELFLIMGSDLFLNLHLWPNAEVLISKVGLVVGVRGGHEVEQALTAAHKLPATPKSLQILDSIERSISSAETRSNIRKNGKSDDIVESVLKYAQKNWLYQDISKEVAKVKKSQ